MLSAGPGRVLRRVTGSYGEHWRGITRLYSRCCMKNRANFRELYYYEVRGLAVNKANLVINPGLCRVLGENASRRVAVSRPTAACDTIDTSHHSLTALLGYRSVVIGHQFPPITKSATEPALNGEVCFGDDASAQRPIFVTPIAYVRKDRTGGELLRTPSRRSSVGPRSDRCRGRGAAEHTWPVS